MGVLIEIRMIERIVDMQEVTPFVGVLIEIKVKECLYENCCVTPFVGVLIEICWSYDHLSNVVCHSLRGSVD